LVFYAILKVVLVLLRPLIAHPLLAMET